ncbi:MAG: efflux RND transporter periplasmic adaptor subunit [Rickettsiales bacterium]|jgi:HlyD family secretion protein|nr:efflux RND transporter periplasmic adaptor subunit [Rickettsiales bacterium]
MKKEKVHKKTIRETAMATLGLIKRLLHYIWRHRLWSAAAIIAIVCAFYFAGSSGNKTAVKFATVPITRGALRQVVTATGEIKPVNTIKVGSQVSGLIETIYVDYNDVVKKNQVLLTIDPSVLQARVDEAKAALESAEATHSKAGSDYSRSKTLYADGFIARTELENDETNFKTSEQRVKQMKSQYDQTVTNLGYATIISPVDGTVISRKVDKGQTVAASFQTPDLFEIAEDLRLMQIQTSVSEADIGMIKIGQPVTFTVDAYPTQTFKGTVQQIRLSPTTTQNVVVYTVIIEVDNEDMRLMPGMTAFVTIMIEEKEDVWKAANSAFLVRDLKSLSDDPRVQSGDLTGRNAILIERGKGPNNLVLIPYKKGLTTATETEIIPTDDTQIQQGDKVVTGKLGEAAKAGSGQQFGDRQRQNGGGGPR